MCQASCCCYPLSQRVSIADKRKKKMMMKKLEMESKFMRFTFLVNVQSNKLYWKLLVLKELGTYN